MENTVIVILDRFVTALLRKGITLKYFKAAHNIAPSFLKRIYREDPLTFTVASNLAQSLGVSLGYLTDWDIKLELTAPLKASNDTMRMIVHKDRFDVSILRSKMNKVKFLEECGITQHILRCIDLKKPIELYIINKLATCLCVSFGYLTNVDCEERVYLNLLVKD